MRQTDVAITGTGLVTPAGLSPAEAFAAIAEGGTTHGKPSSFDAGGFLCKAAGEVRDSRIETLIRDRKAVRLMGRDAVLAAAAARLAMLDSGLNIGSNCEPEDVALFGATGTAGLPFGEIESLVRGSTDSRGRFDLRLFGEQGLRQTRPVISFKILSNMAICFVSIFENIQGPNLIFNPWEGQGALAIREAARCVAGGGARFALAGGCDCKTHGIAFATLQQHGMFDSWRRSERGMVPGEGAAFLLLESLETARERGCRIYGVLRGAGHSSDLDAASRHSSNPQPLAGAMKEAISHAEKRPGVVFSSLDGDDVGDACELEALRQAEVEDLPRLATKPVLTNVFAAAAAANLCMAAHAVSGGDFPKGGKQPDSRGALVNCFGPGTEKVAFILEAP